MPGASNEERRPFQWRATTADPNRPVWRLADDFYLIAHEDRTGRGRIAAPVAGLGLAAGLIAELLLSRLVELFEGGLYPVAGPPPDDELLGEVRSLIADGRQQRDLDTWLAFLAADAVADVRHRLVSCGALARVTTRRMVGTRRVQYCPTDANAAVWPAIRLANLLCRGEGITLADAVLTGLVRASGLLGHVLWFPEEHTPGWATAQQLRTELPTEHPGPASGPSMNVFWVG